MACFFKNMFKKPSNIDIPSNIIPVRSGNDLELDLSDKRIKITNKNLKLYLVIIYGKVG